MCLELKHIPFFRFMTYSDSIQYTQKIILSYLILTIYVYVAATIAFLKSIVKLNHN